MTKDKLRIFIASSTEGLDIAYAVQERLENYAECTVWDQGVFEPSSYVLPDLIKTLKATDCGIFVFSVDDVVQIREKEYETVRDNVILELGLFTGVLGQKNCFIIMPNGKEKIHLPTDLTGINILKYDPKRKDGNLSAALGPSTYKIRNTISENNAKNRMLPDELVEQIKTAGLSAFYTSRGDYAKYREHTASIDKYIATAFESIYMISITLATGIPVDDICKVFVSKLKEHEDFRVVISLLNPYNEDLYKTIQPLFDQPEKTLRDNTISALNTLMRYRNTLDVAEQKRFILKVHNTLPFGSAIILDGDTENGVIQIETKPYDTGMRNSFALELRNNNGPFYERIKKSYYKLVDDGIDCSELPLN